MDDLLLVIGNYGFPMVVASYLLVRLEPCIRGLERSISLLTVVMARQGGVDVDDARRILEDGKDRR
ncbi:MAG: YvrJ family protein [Eubacteriales bacterium]|jgi:hypothetical protein|nr:YvrJ family protein [Pseudomonadota bacterium]MBU4532593.1 YvrJ family protein [Bacillota bacterium]MBV1728538.1 YvrJ family protein [Desulforudis sp.]MDQ7790463.1 YvrJ family protein [Clostridia bacterium]MDZ4042610.1 YvrJ family protein [Eubacteriales bacterium]